MPNPENVIEHQLKPGESLPGCGRPKGTRNRSTIITEILEAIQDGKELDGTETKKEIEYWVTLKKVKNALAGRDTAINDVLDWKYGKQVEKKEINAKVNTIDELVNEMSNKYEAPIEKQAEKIAEKLIETAQIAAT
jgi:hypothetical protein